ncbi:MAG: VCBS repeat-containing protein [Microthrixaceae bacterium]
MADLDADGDPDVAVTDVNGDVTAWRHDGTLLFRSSANPRFSEESGTDRVNRHMAGFLAAPAAADLDGDGTLEVVAAALDRHVYAFHADGRAVTGFPVLVVDPARTRAVDPLTHRVTFDTAKDDEMNGGELVATPALGDLDGDGHPDIVVGAQEQYGDESASVFPPLQFKGLSANTRLYAIASTGTATPHRGGVDAAPQHPDEQAYLPGWPVRVPMLMGDVLPLIGDGVNAQVAIANVDYDAAPEVIASSAAGPLMVFDADGKSALGRNVDLPVALDWLGTPFGGLANSRDGGVVTAAFGGPAVGDLDGDGYPDVAAPTVGLTRALDQLLPGHQNGDTQLSAWNPRTAHMLAGFPHKTRDLGFFITPAIVDVDGDGHREVVAGHGVSLVDAVDAQGREPAGWPKLTGGWVVGTPGFGDVDGDGRAEMAVVRRDGHLMVWSTRAPARDTGAWMRFGHDGTNDANVASP